jgi:hypothetical protein
MKRNVLLTISIIWTVSGTLQAQGIATRFASTLPPNVNGGYGIRGAGGLRANSIAGSGGLRGSSILGSGGMGGFYSGSKFASVTRGAYGGGGAGSIYGAGFGGGGGSKPFSSYSSPPTVSPYLNLFRVDLAGNNNLNYSTLVRPQLQQQQLNQQLEQQNLQSARRLQAIAAQANFNPQGAKDQYPTGHQTVFGYMGHYYPVPRRNVKRARQQQ